jgi:hypothetical protein
MQFLPLVKKLEKAGRREKSLKSSIYIAFSSRNFMPKKQDIVQIPFFCQEQLFNTIATKSPINQFLVSQKSSLAHQV